jgi:2,5-diamino-6-(ribosylamino)-4(3H)-pyrimidinone 5'-phosphate reductase
MLPRVILHNAVSVDGRFDGFTPDMGLFYGLITRWNEDATLCGSNTFLSAPETILPEEPGDLEPLTVDPKDKRPLLVIPDSRGRIKSWHHWRRQPYWRDYVTLCSKITPREHLDYLRKLQIHVIQIGDDHVELRAALEELNARFGVAAVRADCGGTLNGALLRAGLVDEISILIHPAVVGGISPRSLFHSPDLAPGVAGMPCRLKHIERPGSDMVWLIYEVTKPAKGSS